MDDGAFSWDDNKAISNYLKHGIGFEDAIHVFKDPFALDWFDEDASYEEYRYCTIGLGLVAGRILFVAYTERNDVIRIISARGATPYEKKLYYEENSSNF